MKFPCSFRGLEVGELRQVVSVPEAEVSRGSVAELHEERPGKGPDLVIDVVGLLLRPGNGPKPPLLHDTGRGPLEPSFAGQAPQGVQECMLADGSAEDELGMCMDIPGPGLAWTGGKYEKGSVLEWSPEKRVVCHGRSPGRSPFAREGLAELPQPLKGRRSAHACAPEGTEALGKANVGRDVQDELQGPLPAPIHP